MLCDLRLHLWPYCFRFMTYYHLLWVTEMWGTFKNDTAHRLVKIFDTASCYVTVIFKCQADGFLNTLCLT